MAIKHADIKVSGDRGYASEWNKDHVIEESSKAKRSVTLIVAASDSLDKTKADYVCDGVNDEAEIGTALSSLNVTGGEVLLLDGTYNIENVITITKANTTLCGMGRNTILYSTTTDYIISTTGVDNIIIEKICFKGPVSGIYLNSSYITIRECFFVDLVTSIYALWANDFIVDGCFFLTTGTGINAMRSIYRMIVKENIYENCEYGVLSAGKNSVISDNVFKSCNEAIMLTWLVGGANDSTVTGNVCEGGDKGIQLAMNSDRNIITGNNCRGQSTSSISIEDSSCENNVIHGNIHQTAIVDSGTNTQKWDNYQI